jgi:hypothetical protein
MRITVEEMRDSLIASLPSEAGLAVLLNKKIRLENLKGFINVVWLLKSHVFKLQDQVFFSF